MTSQAPARQPAEAGPSDGEPARRAPERAEGPAPLPLSVRDLVMRGDEGRTLLDLPALDVAPGEALAVVGPSGAGKSTLLFALAGLAPPASGRIAWGGVDVAGLATAARTAFRRRHLGLVFQDHLLFEELDAGANAALSRAWAPPAERPAIASRAGALLAALGLPDGRRGVATFSGGERQRVAVARALAAGPGAVLADEPTASLDRASAETLARTLVGLARDEGRTLIVATHDEALMARATRVLRLDGGRPA